jgi:hypothetical protein
VQGGYAQGRKAGLIKTRLKPRRTLRADRRGSHSHRSGGGPGAGDWGSLAVPRMTAERRPQIDRRVECLRMWRNLAPQRGIRTRGPLSRLG